MKTYFKKKNGFALITTLSFIIVLSLVIYLLTEQNTFMNNINKLKYLNIQANIHMDRIINQIKENENIKADEIILHDERFDLKVTIKDYNNSKIYYIKIKSSKNEPVTLYEIIDRSKL